MSSLFNSVIASNLPSVSVLPFPLINFGLIAKPPFSNSIAIGSNHTFLKSSSKKASWCCGSMAVEFDPASSLSQDGLQGSLNYSRAYWPSKYIIAWNVDIENGSYYLFASKTASLKVTDAGIEGYDVKVKLEKDQEGLPINVTEKFPHIRGYSAFRAPATLDVKSLLKCQLAVAVSSGDGACRNATGLQLPGVIDELYSYDGPLGPVFSEDSLSLYLWAPTAQDSAGILHLKKLSAAGLTHLHLLPSFQFAEVDDDKTKWKFVDTRQLETLPPDSEEQQARITAIRDEDNYNWGYNPVLWGTPKGSYATNPNGPSRIIEFRKMVRALNHIGLRIVLDVVYNHLYSSGPSDVNSVLDKLRSSFQLRLLLNGSLFTV